MQITKKVLGTLERVYATSIMKLNGETSYLVASEGQGSCVVYTEGNYAHSTVWDGPGGTMNIVPIPNRENEFIATQKFFPTFQAEESEIVHAKLNNDNTWTITTIMKIPYLHRFDVFEINNKLYFIGATLCESKESKEDWSKPGKIYVGEFSSNIVTPFKLVPIIEGITKNHGFCKGTWQGKNAFLVSGSEGVFVIYIPETSLQKWEFEKILDYEVSDIAVCDIDNDGIEELATIEGFHGSKGKIYKNINGKLTSIHEHEYEFGHVVWGGNILNKPSFIIGGRKGNRHVICFQFDNATGKIKEFLIDDKGGPSNISIINKDNMDIILAANREIGEVAIYEITE